MRTVKTARASPFTSRTYDHAAMKTKRCPQCDNALVLMEITVQSTNARLAPSHTSQERTADRTPRQMVSVSSI